MKKTVATLIVGLSISTAALAFGGGQHRNHFDWDELDLTDVQEEQIDDIKDNFHDKFSALRSADGSREDKREQFIELRKNMMADIKAVLTPEQKKEAQALVMAKAEKHMNKRLKKLSRKLDLTDEQKDSLKTHMQTKLASVQVQLESGTLPEKGNRKSLMKEFDQQMQNILSEEQLTKWNEMKEKRIQHMAKHEGGDKRWFRHN